MAFGLRSVYEPQLATSSVCPKNTDATLRGTMLAHAYRLGGPPLRTRHTELGF